MEKIVLNITRGRGADQEFPEKETDEWGREETEIMVAYLWMCWW